MCTKDPPNAVRLWLLLELAVEAADALALDLDGHECTDYSDHPTYCPACGLQQASEGMGYTLNMFAGAVHGDLVDGADTDLLEEVAHYLDGVLDPPEPDAVVGAGETLR